MGEGWKLGDKEQGEIVEVNDSGQKLTDVNRNTAHAERLANLESEIAAIKKKVGI